MISTIKKGYKKPRVLRINYSPRKWQRKEEQKEKKRFHVRVVHRNGGKTYQALAEALSKTIACPHPTTTTAYISPTKTQATKICVPILKTLLKRFPSDVYKLLEGGDTVELTLFPDSNVERKMYILGASHPDSLRGIRLDFVILDEAGDMPADFFEAIIQPALRKEKDYIELGYEGMTSGALFIGTPKGKNAFFYYYQKGKVGSDPEWSASCYPINVTGEYTEREIEALKRSVDEDIYLREYMCEFIAPQKGSYFGKHVLHILSSPPYELCPNTPIFWGWDIGYDTTCAWAIQYQRKEGVYRPVLVDFFSVIDEDIPTALAGFKQAKEGILRGALHYVPHDAAKRSSIDKNITTKGVFDSQDLPTRLCKRLPKDEQIRSTRLFLAGCGYTDNVIHPLYEVMDHREKVDKATGIGLGIPARGPFCHSADALMMVCLFSNVAESIRQENIFKFKEENPEEKFFQEVNHEFNPYIGKHHGNF